MNLQTFQNNGFTIRVLGDEENPLFVAKDICQALGLNNVSIKVLVEHEKRLQAIEERVEKLFSFLTIYEYFSYKKLGKLPISDAARYGRTLTKFCKRNNILMGKTTDPRFGAVNTYPLEVLDEYFQQ